jgi:DNA repair exonuclease SbcCD ATPase subunit
LLKMTTDIKVEPLKQLEDFVRQLQIIASGDLGQNLSKILAENGSLRTQVEELRITNGHNMKHAAGLQALIEELKSKLKEKSELNKTLTEDARVFAGEKDALVAEKKTIQGRLDAADLVAKKQEAEHKKALEDMKRLLDEARNNVSNLVKEKKEIHIKLQKYEGIKDNSDKLLKAERESAALRAEAHKLRADLDALRGMAATLQRSDHEAL